MSEAQREHAPAPFANTNVTTTAVAAKRVKAAPLEVNLGEAVHGSTHRYVVADTTILDPDLSVPTSISIDASPRGLFEEEQRSILFQPYARVEQLRVAFTPASYLPRGHTKHSGAFKLRFSWPDTQDSVERTIQLTATSFSIDAIKTPGSTYKLPEKEPEQADLQGLATSDASLTTIANEAEIEVADIAGRQLAGLNRIRSEMASYKGKVTPGTDWGPLAKLAVGMALSGVSGVGAAAMLAQLSAALLASKTRLASAGKKLAEGDSSIVQGLGEALQDGIGSAISMVGSIGDGKAPEKADEKEFDVGEFFETQELLIASGKRANSSLVELQRRKLQHVLRSDASLAVDSMLAIKESLHSKAAVADTYQKAETSRQLVTGISQNSAGQQLAESDGRRKVVTNFDDGFGRPAGNTYGAGLLRIDVSITHGDDLNLADYQINSAALDGVPPAVVGRVVGEPLKGKGVPFRITAHSSAGTAWITCDEAGRVLVTGKLPVHDGAPTTANMHRNAVALCNRIAEKSLSSAGIHVNSR